MKFASENILHKFHTRHFPATSPETRACPYMGKFEVNNLMRNERASYMNKYSHLPDRFYLDSSYYGNKLSRPGFSDENHLRRIKRIDQDFDCDSSGYTNLIIGCNNVDTMEFRSECSAPDFITCEYLLRFIINGVN